MRGVGSVTRSRVREGLGTRSLVGASGGARGALVGPSIMVGGSLDAWKTVEILLQDIAKTEFDLPMLNAGARNLP